MEPEDSPLFVYILVVVFLSGFVTLCVFTDTGGPSKYDLFHEKCLKGGHTQTECTVFWHQMNV